MADSLLEDVKVFEDANGDLLVGAPVVADASRTIPVSIAKDVSEKTGFQQIIIFGRDPETGLQQVTTYGSSKALCRETARASGYLKKALKWPEEKTVASAEKRISFEMPGNNSLFPLSGTVTLRMPDRKTAVSAYVSLLGTLRKLSDRVESLGFVRCSPQSSYGGDGSVEWEKGDRRINIAVTPGPAGSGTFVPSKNYNLYAPEYDGSWNGVRGWLRTYEDLVDYYGLDDPSL